MDNEPPTPTPPPTSKPKLGGVKRFKFLTLIVNFILFVIGIAVICAGAIVKIQFNDYNKVIGNNFLLVPISIIVVGVLLFLVAIFGLISAMKESRSMLQILAVLLVVAMVLEFGASISGLLLRHRLVKEVKPLMWEFVKGYRKGVGKPMDTIQKKFKCCGVEGPIDYFQLPIRLQGSVVGDAPTSCCKPAELLKTTQWLPKKCDTKTPLDLKSSGCYKKLESWMATHMIIVGVVGVTFFFVLFLGVIFACCFARSIKFENI